MKSTLKKNLTSGEWVSKPEFRTRVAFPGKEAFPKKVDYHKNSDAVFALRMLPVRDALQTGVDKTRDRTLITLIPTIGA